MSGFFLKKKPLFTIFAGARELENRFNHLRWGRRASRLNLLWYSCGHPGRRGARFALRLRHRPHLRSSIMTMNRVKRQLRIRGRCPLYFYADKQGLPRVPGELKVRVHP